MTLPVTGWSVLQAWYCKSSNCAWILSAKSKLAVGLSVSVLAFSEAAVRLKVVKLL